MSNINVLVLDEAHHAMKDHVMHQLMSQYALSIDSERPRVIGLTGMLLSGKVKPDTVVSHLEKLEATLHATIATVNSFEDHEHVLSYSTNPDEKIVRYDTVASSPFQQKIGRIVATIKEKVENWPETGTVSDKIKKMLDDYLHQQRELGEYFTRGESFIFLLIFSFLNERKLRVFHCHSVRPDRNGIAEIFVRFQVHETNGQTVRHLWVSLFIFNLP